MYQLNGTQFKTKDALKKYIQQVIKTLDLCIINEKHEYYDMFLELINQHDNRETKIGCGIRRFSIQHNPQNSMERSLYLHRIDGSREIWSYKSCIGIKKNELNEAMRSAVIRQTYEYKKKQPLVCCYCGTDNLESEEYHTDHKTVPFSVIKDNFLKQDINIPTEFSKNKIFCNTIFRSEDNEFEKQWYDYHKQHADYQILCKNCNLKKSNKACL